MINNFDLEQQIHNFDDEENIDLDYPEAEYFCNMGKMNLFPSI
jgi:hypothetical protein